MEGYRYQNEFKIDSSVEDRRKKDVGDIYLNQAHCLLCGEVIISKNRHDYVTCKCGALSVDGGSWYCKRLFKKDEDWEDVSIAYKNVEVENG